MASSSSVKRFFVRTEGDARTVGEWLLKAADENPGCTGPVIDNRSVVGMYLAGGCYMCVFTAVMTRELADDGSEYYHLSLKQTLPSPGLLPAAARSFLVSAILGPDARPDDCPLFPETSHYVRTI